MCTEEFGEYDMGRGGHSGKTCMGRISICYDVLHKTVLDDTPDNYRCSEKEQFGNFAPLLLPGDVPLTDGYCAKHGVPLAVLDSRAHFVVPLTEKPLVVKRFPRQKKGAERAVTITFTDSRTKEPAAIKGRPMKKKTNGKYRVPFTSLPQGKDCPRGAIFTLYGTRWEVETCYGHLKNTLEMADWSGKSVPAVRQDFKARILLHNLTALLCHPIRPKKKKVDAGNGPTNRKRTLNFPNAISRCRSLLVKILKGRDIMTLTDEFSENVKARIEYSRKGQTRKRTYFEGRKYHMNQKHA